VTEYLYTSLTSVNIFLCFEKKYNKTKNYNSSGAFEINTSIFCGVDIKKGTKLQIMLLYARKKKRGVWAKIKKKPDFLD